MKKFTIILAALFMVSCKSDKKFNSYGFEGLYEMRTETYWTNKSGHTEKNSRDIISSVQMYVQDEHLYVRTNTFGMPNIGDYDLTEVEYSLDPSYTPQTRHANDNEGGENGEISGIEIAPDNGMTQILILDGHVFVNKSNKRLKSLPIQALDIKEDRIILKNSDTFEVPITDEDGNLIPPLRCHYEYGPAIIKDGSITWNVILKGDNETNTTNEDIVRIHVKYHNTLVRK